MSNHVSFISGQLATYGGASLTNKMFGVLSDISNNFQKELTEVKDRQSAAPKASVAEKLGLEDRVLEKEEVEVEPEEILEGDSLEDVEEKKEEEIEVPEEESSRENPFEEDEEPPHQEEQDEEIACEAQASAQDDRFNRAMENAEKNAPEEISVDDRTETEAASMAVFSLGGADEGANSVGKILESKIKALSPESDSKAEIPIALSEKMKQDLSSIRANGVISSPLVGKVSPDVMNGLKAVNPEMAKGIEAATPLDSEAKIQATPSKPSSSVSSSGAQSEKISLQEGQEKALEQMERMEKRVIEQVKVQIRASVQGNVSSITLKLKPHFLGDLAVEMSIEGSKVSANFVVETQTVKAILEKNIDDLKSMLREQGFEVEEVNVTVSEDPHQEDRPGTQFASIEEKKAAQEWVSSFAHLRSAREGEVMEVVPSRDTERNSDRLLDVVA